MTASTIGTAEHIGTWPTGSAEWLAARLAGLGGSEVAACLGLSPFESKFSLYHRKTGTIAPVEQSPEMEWGSRLEPVIIAKFLEEHPEYVPAGTATYRHAERPWQITNPDQLLAAPGNPPHTLLETKYSVMGDGWGETGTDEVPVHVRIQALWYCDIFGFAQAHVAVLISGCDFREYVIPFDETEAQLLRTAGRKFLDDVAAGNRPDIDDHSATYQAVRELHPDIDPEDAHIGEDLARQYCHARTLLAQADFEHALARALVADAMGNAHRAVWDKHTIATRQARDGGVPYVVAGRNLPTFAPQETAAA